MTELLYLSNQNILETEAKVIDIQPFNQEMKLWSLVVDKTPFYPQGGGQPSDQGTVTFEKNDFEVSLVRKVDGEIRHFLPKLPEGLACGSPVYLSVNRNIREFHSRLHSAGEVIPAAIKALGFTEWKVKSAIHFQDRAAVEYDLSLPAEKREEFKDKLENMVKVIVDADLPIEIFYPNSHEHLKNEIGFIPDYLPGDIPVRVVKVSGHLGRPCMGTHVGSTGKIGPVQIRKVKSKKGTTTISYLLQS